MKTFHTFVIPAYGESPYLEECIRSLKSQTVPSGILCCTATPNEYIRKLCEACDVPLHIREGEPGIGPDWRFAWEMAEAEYVTIAHQDDIYRRTYTEELRSASERYPDMLLFASDYLTVKMRGREACPEPVNAVWAVKKLLRLPLRMKGLADRRMIKRLPLMFGNSICCPACTYRKGVIGEEIFTEGGDFALDWLNLLSLANREGRFVVSEKPLIAYRVHEGAATAANIRNHRRAKEEKEVFERIWGRPAADFLMRFYGAAEDEYKE